MYPRLAEARHAARGKQRDWNEQRKKRVPRRDVNFAFGKASFATGGEARENVVTTAHTRRVSERGVRGRAAEGFVVQHPATRARRVFERGIAGSAAATRFAPRKTRVGARRVRGGLTEPEVGEKRLSARRLDGQDERQGNHENGCATHHGSRGVGDASRGARASWYGVLQVRDKERRGLGGQKRATCFVAKISSKFASRCSWPRRFEPQALGPLAPQPVPRSLQPDPQPFQPDPRPPQPAPQPTQPVRTPSQAIQQLRWPKHRVTASRRPPPPAWSPQPPQSHEGYPPPPLSPPRSRVSQPPPPPLGPQRRAFPKPDRRPARRGGRSGRRSRWGAQSLTPRFSPRSARVQRRSQRRPRPQPPHPPRRRQRQRRRRRLQRLGPLLCPPSPPPCFPPRPLLVRPLLPQPPSPPTSPRSPPRPLGRGTARSRTSGAYPRPAFSTPRSTTPRRLV
mmetsp:Transcript_11950/g.39700  ORF Transcript_11950/g.39700 Transcript_11950/m.39700 type:complete len:451 (-) Transcript_11950:1783-3135(-)